MTNSGAERRTNSDADNKACYPAYPQNMNVSLTPELEERVRHKVESGRYLSASEVMRERFDCSKNGTSARSCATRFARASTAALPNRLIWRP